MHHQHALSGQYAGASRVIGRSPANSVMSWPMATDIYSMSRQKNPSDAGTNVKDRLAFCALTQDGDDEGCLHLDRPPTPDETAIIREALGIRKRRHLSPEELAALRLRLGQIQPPTKSASNAQGFAETAGPMGDSLEEAEAD
jgi:hypothetical protein